MRQTWLFATLFLLLCSEGMGLSSSMKHFQERFETSVLDGIKNCSCNLEFPCQNLIQTMRQQLSPIQMECMPQNTCDTDEYYFYCVHQDEAFRGAIAHSRSLCGTKLQMDDYNTVAFPNAQCKKDCVVLDQEFLLANSWYFIYDLMGFPFLARVEPTSPYATLFRADPMLCAPAIQFSTREFVDEFLTSSSISSTSTTKTTTQTATQTATQTTTQTATQTTTQTTKESNVDSTEKSATQTTTETNVDSTEKSATQTDAGTTTTIYDAVRNQSMGDIRPRVGTTSSAPEESKSMRLPDGAWAGIGCLVALVVVAVATIFFQKKRRVIVESAGVFNPVYGTMDPPGLYEEVLPAQPMYDLAENNEGYEIPCTPSVYDVVDPHTEA